ncbi:MAG: ABC transporter permease [Myxococcota bacterium]
MPDISIASLLLSLAPCGGVVWIAQRWAGRGGELTVAVVRMAAQLLIIGYVLVVIFETRQWWVGAFVVAVMIAVAGPISVRLVRDQRLRTLGHAWTALALGGGGALVFVYAIVLRVRDPWYQPRIVIPIAGMVFANAMTAITLAAERFQKERQDGAGYVASRKAAWSAAMIPQVNALLAVGLVSLPGIMTGQILSGVDPLVAVRYQIVVMAMVLQASGFSVAVFLRRLRE